MTNTDFDPATAVLDDIAGDYTLDPAHTRLGFSARHAMVATVRGQFGEFSGTAHVDTANPADSKVEVQHRRQQHQHRQRAARRPPALRRLLREPSSSPTSPSPRPTSPATATTGRSPAT